MAIISINAVQVREKKEETRERTLKKLSRRNTTSREVR